MNSVNLRNTIQDFRPGKPQPIVICGFEGDKLAEDVAKKLDMKVNKILTKPFGDTSSNLRIETNSKKKKGAFAKRDVYIIASNCRKPEKDIDKTTMEVNIAIDAATETTEGDVKLYIPHLGYARQDKVSQSGEPRAAQAVLKMFAALGAKKITVLDIHNEEAFDVLRDKAKYLNKFAMDVFAKEFKEMQNKGIDLNNIVVVAPDKGAIDRAKRFQKKMQKAGFKGVAIAYFDKSRNMAIKGKVSSMDLREFYPENCDEPLLGDDAKNAFKGITAIVVDDMADTCGTMLRAIKDNIVGRYAAKVAYAVITHGVFSNDALKKIRNTKELEKIFVTDSIPLRIPPGEKQPANLKVVSCASVIADAICKEAFGLSLDAYRQSVDALRQSV